MQLCPHPPAAVQEIESPAQSFANLPDLGESFGFGVSPTSALGSSISSPNLLRVQVGRGAWQAQGGVHACSAELVGQPGSACPHHSMTAQGAWLAPVHSLCTLSEDMAGDPCRGAMLQGTAAPWPTAAAVGPPSLGRPMAGSAPTPAAPRGPHPLGLWGPSQLL